MSAVYKCVWCGNVASFELPWQGRPQGPRCPCNPNSWGNWAPTTAAPAFRARATVAAESIDIQDLRADWTPK